MRDTLQQSQEARLIFTKINDLQRKITPLHEEQKVLAQEEKTLQVNQQIGGTANVLKAADLREMMDYQRTNLQRIYARNTEIAALLSDYEAKKMAFGQTYSYLKSPLRGKHLLVIVQTKQALVADFSLRNFSYDASWTPHYDLRVKDLQSPIELTYKAAVKQSSGETWTNVHLHLSSGEPIWLQDLPTLDVWRLQTKKEINRTTKDTVETYDPATYEEKIKIVMGEKSDNELQDEFVKKQTTSQFDPPAVYTILEDGKPTDIELQVLNLPATYSYFCIPKRSPAAYLTGYVTNLGQYNLLSGDYALYVENTYLGTNSLEAHPVNDTLSLSLGVDKSIIVKRTKEREFSSKQFLGNKRTDERGFLILIRNTKDKAIPIVIKDQIPISSNKEITVEKVEAKGATIDAEKGFVEWRTEIPANTEKRFILHYEVKSPKKDDVLLE